MLGLRGLSLLDITPKFRIVAMFGILNFETIFHINSVGMFVICLSINFKTPTPNIHYLGPIKPQNQEDIHTSSSRFDSLQKKMS